MIDAKKVLEAIKYYEIDNKIPNLEGVIKAELGADGKPTHTLYRLLCAKINTTKWSTLRRCGFANYIDKYNKYIGWTLGEFSSK